MSAHSISKTRFRGAIFAFKTLEYFVGRAPFAAGIPAATADFSSLMGCFGVIWMIAPIGINSNSWPGLICIDSHSSLGSEIWNLLDRVAVVILRIRDRW